MFIAEDTLHNVRNSLSVPSRQNVFTTFLILKYQDIKTNSIKKYDMVKIKEAIDILMSIYSDGEVLPTRYSLIFPVSISKEDPWDVSEGIENYVTRVANNLRSTIDWRGIVDFDERTAGGPYIRFTHDYIHTLKEICKIKRVTDRVDIRLLAAWTFREHDLGTFNNDFDFTQQVVNMFKALFNITEIEEKELFHHNGPLLNYSTTVTPISTVRQWLPLPLQRGQPTSERKRSFFIHPMQLKSLAITMSSNPDWQKVKDSLDKQKQIILYGPPGTSKTYLANQVSTSAFRDTTLFVQFHPNYGYEEFIGGLRPSEKGSPPFEPKPGIFLEFVKKAESNGNKEFLLIIDEINRGNLSKIFGETISCLDRDNPPVVLAFNSSIQLKLPDNLFIIGTMNSTDRSIALVDYALRRRFYFLYLSPDPSLLASVTDDSKLDGVSIVQLFNKINQRIAENPSLGKEFQLGHTYFMPNYLKANQTKIVWTADDLNFVFNNSILPLVEEYCYGNQTLLRAVLGNELIKRLAGKTFIDAVKNYLAS